MTPPPTPAHFGFNNLLEWLRELRETHSPFYYQGHSLVAQMEKCLPAMWDMGG